MARLDELILRRKHPDPEDLARDEAPARLRERRSRLETGGMQLLRAALMAPGAPDLRESVLDDLRSFFTDSYLSSADHRQGAAREAVAMWSINLLWYAYLQSEGFAHPVLVDIRNATPKAPPGGRHLDFGSGVGVTSQLFHSLGYRIDLADIEEGLLAFAMHRLERRGIAAQPISLLKESLPADSYDAITAIDTLTFVSDFRGTAQHLRSALKPGGVMFANLDTRHGVRIGWEIVHFDDLELRRRLQGAGFEPGVKLGGGVRRYVGVPTRGVRHLGRRARDMVMFPARRTFHATRARLGRKADRPRSTGP